MVHNSVNDIPLCISLCTSVAVREHLTCRKQFINIMGNEKYLDNVWTLKDFGHFLDNIFGQHWTSDRTEFEKYPNLTPPVRMDRKRINQTEMKN